MSTKVRCDSCLNSKIGYTGLIECESPLNKHQIKYYHKKGYCYCTKHKECETI